MRFFNHVTVKEGEDLDKDQDAYILFVRVNHNKEDFSLGWVLVVRLPSYWYGGGYAPSAGYVFDEEYAIWWQRVLFIRAIHPQGWGTAWEWIIDKQPCVGEVERIEKLRRERFAPPY